MPNDDLFISMEDMPVVPTETSPMILTPEIKAKSAKEQRENLELVLLQERTYVILAAIHKEENRNSLNKITCKKGIPIGGYVYDATSDSYVIACADYLQVGYIPVSMILRVTGQNAYQVRVPLAEVVLKRFLSQPQKKDLKNFRSVYKPEDYILQYIQMIDCNG